MVTFGLLVVSFLATAHGAEWSHSAAATWKENYPNCEGEQQSPIAIKHSDSYYFNMGPFKFGGYNKENIQMQIVNNGHTVQVNFNETDNITLKGGSLPGDNYHLNQMHFHWGSQNYQGSEHTLNGRAYAAELHFVHHDETHGDIANAADKDEGLAVLGIFIKVGQYDNPHYAKLIELFSDVMHKGQTKTIPQGFRLASLLPQDTNLYYRYDGGLTTPPCHQSVVWTVFADPVVISQQQMDAFRMLKENAQGDEVMDDNFRPVQPLNNRRVYVSIWKMSSSAPSITSTFTVLSIIITKVLSLVFYH